MTHLEEFSARLKQQMTLINMKHSPTRLAAAFNAVSGQKAITVHAARKWLCAEAIPTHSKMIVLADMMCTTPQWLRFGEQEAPTPAPSLNADERILLAHFKNMSGAGRKALMLTAAALAGVGHA